MRSVLVALLLSTLAACESDVKKAERLRTEMLRACLAVLVAESSGDWSHVTAPQRAECDVARREQRRFLEGR